MRGLWNAKHNMWGRGSQRIDWKQFGAATFRGTLDCLLWAGVAFGLGSLPLVFQMYRGTVASKQPPGASSYPEIWVYIIAISVSIMSAAVVERTRTARLANLAAVGSAFALAFASDAYATASHPLLNASESAVARATLIGVTLLAIIFILPEKIGDNL